MYLRFINFTDARGIHYDNNNFMDIWVTFIHCLIITTASQTIPFLFKSPMGLLTELFKAFPPHGLLWAQIKQKQMLECYIQSMARQCRMCEWGT